MSFLRIAVSLGILVLSHGLFDVSSERPLSIYADLDRCLLVMVPSGSYCEKDPGCAAASACSDGVSKVDRAFRNDERVYVRYYNDSWDGWIKDSVESELALTEESCVVLVYKKPILDRTCLTTLPPVQPSKPLVMSPLSSPSFEAVLSSINSACGTFRLEGCGLSVQGHHRQYIKDNLFSVKSLENSVTAYEVFPVKQFPISDIPQCERVTIKSWNQFFVDYLQISKPVIITGAIDSWKAKSKWTNRFLRQKYGNQKVHIKMSPTSDYEGIEPAQWWENYERFYIPPTVKFKLQFPDLVVPRPAPLNMNFSEFVDLMELIGNGSISNASAYLEYSSIRNYFPELEGDISEVGFLDDKMMLRHLNIWLSDGNTLGKLHFDPFDNFLCMIDGTKELLLFEPHDNHQLYESHIPEAEYSVNKTTLKFQRRRLMESTSMVMSPVDIRQPDFERFPLFKDARPLNCTIHEGDVLFMPSFWWHEVQSYPDKTTKRNLAVNYWYEPFLTKEFPCRDCDIDVNPLYFHLL